MKNKEKIYLFLLCALCLLQRPAFTFDGEQLEDKVSAFNRYYDNHYQELIYLHTDKSQYIAGEQIRFKAFCLDKSTSKLSQLSKVAYVEVLDETNTPMMQAKIELVNGTGQGEVFIPTNISSGNFILRGYTRWMRNDGPDTFFHSIITIINPFKRLGLSPLADEKDISIRFFPESQALIDGVKSKVVYDFRDSNSKPCAATGKLIANDSLLVAELSSSETGLGFFEFTPAFRQKYHVEVQHDDGSVSQHAFVPIVQEGLSLLVNRQEAGHSLEIFCNDREIVGASEELYYLIHRNGKILAGDHVRLEGGVASVQIDFLSMEPGISSITLFSEDGRFLRQRKFFTASGPNEELILASKNSWTQREKASFQMSTSAVGSKAGIADLSVSVSSHQPGVGIPQLGLDEYLLIGNVLNEQMFRVAEVLNGPAKQVSSSINQLLIAYPKVDTTWLSKDFADQKYIPEYRAHLISGKMTNKLTNDPARGISAYLSVVGKHVQFNSSMSKLDGSLIFEMENFYGPKEVVLLTDHTKDSLYTITLDDPFSLEYANIEVPVFDIDEGLASWVKDQSQWMQVRNAYKRYEPKSTLDMQVDTTAFFGEPDARYYLDDFTRFIVMEEVMREYVAGVNVRRNKDGFHFMVLDIDRNDIFQHNPLMLLDGIPVFDADDIIALDPLKIQKIETVKRRFHKGFLDCRGIVSFTSYKGDLSGYELKDNAVVTQYHGLQKKRPFHSPTYATEFEKRATTPDFRNVLLWNTEHESLTKDNSIDFYTSDAAGTYQIFINVLTEDGKAYSDIKRFSVISHKEN